MSARLNVLALINSMKNAGATIPTTYAEAAKWMAGSTVNQLAVHCEYQRLAGRELPEDQLQTCWERALEADAYRARKKENG